MGANCETPEHAKAIQHLFDTLDEKPVPLYSCKGWIDGIKWRVPAQMSCPLVDVATTSEIIQITLWWEDITMNIVPAYECYAEKLTHRRAYFFFGGYDEDRIKEKEPMRKDDCEHMISSKRTPYGKPMTRIRDGFFGTEEVPNAEWYWASSDVLSVTNYYFIHMKIAISNEDASIQTTTKLLDHCQYHAETCPTELGLLIWDYADKNTCRLKEGVSTKCVLTNGRISCPEADIALTKYTNKNLCNLTVGVSAQGIIFTLDEKFTDDSFQTSRTADVRHIVNNKIRVGRSVSNNTNTWLFDTTFTPTSQLNAKFQYLYDLIKANVTYSVQSLHSEVCKANKRMLELLRILAQGGSPSLLVRILLGSDQYRARLNGDVLSVWMCESIYNYMMMPKDDCIFEWPVTYMEGHDKKTGYLTPLSHEIIETPTRTECPSPDYYFDTGDYVVLLTNRTIAAALPTLPKPSENINISSMPELSFKAPGVYTVSEISGQETLIELVREMRSRYQIDDIMNAKRKGVRLRGSETRIMNFVQNAATNPIKAWFYRMITTCLTVLLVAVLIYNGIIYNQQILKFLTLRCANMAEKIKRNEVPKDAESQSSSEMHEIIELIPQPPYEDEASTGNSTGPQEIYPTLIADMVDETPRVFRARLKRVPTYKIKTSKKLSGK